jgi:aminoglycoside phosphotransferase (APT) family kinase protein
VTAHPSWRELQPAQQTSLGTQIGDALARIHTHRERSFGSVDGPVADWLSLWRERVASFLARMATHGPLIGDLVGRWRRVVEANEALFAAVSEAALLHGDFQLGNMLQQGGRLTGVIDMEWARYGDPAFDFATDYHWRKYSPGSAERIYAAYATHHSLDNAARKRIACYRLIPMIEDAVYAHQIGWMDGRGWHWSREQIERHITELEGSSGH